MTDAPLAGTFAILGATGAVGSTLARDLAARGGRLVLLARDEARLAEVAGPLGARTGLLTDCRPSAVRRADIPSETSCSRRRSLKRGATSSVAWSASIRS